MKKVLPLLLAALVLWGCAGKTEENLPVMQTTAVLETTQETIPETTAQPTTEPMETEPEEERFLLTFAGDCTFGTNPTNAYADFGFLKTVGENYRYPFQNVIGYFEKDEFSLVNLEGPLTQAGNPMQKPHTFRGPTAYVKILTENSVEAVTIANNHTFDYGQAGYDSTVATLEEAGVPFVERDGSAVVTTKNGLKIGLYGAVYYLLDTKTITGEIKALKDQGCDLVIFLPHWGTEGTYHPTREQTEVGRAAIDAGADIVCGSHPHVLQPVEEYNGGVIYYSLGNFSFGGNGYPKDYDTALLQQEVIRDENGVRLGERTMIPCSVSSVSDRNNYQPTPYPLGSEAYERVLSKLDGSFAGPSLPIG